MFTLILISLIFFLSYPTVLKIIFIEFPKIKNMIMVVILLLFKRIFFLNPNELKSVEIYSNFNIYFVFIENFIFELTISKFSLNFNELLCQLLVIH